MVFIRRTAILVGASGLIGSKLLAICLNNPYYHQVFIFVRKKIHLDHPKLIQFLVNFETLTYQESVLKNPANDTQDVRNTDADQASYNTQDARNTDDDPASNDTQDVRNGDADQASLNTQDARNTDDDPALAHHLESVNWFSSGSMIQTKIFNDADVYCTLGTTRKKSGTKEAFRRVDFHYVAHFAQMAKKYQSRQFLVVTAMGAHKTSPFFYSRVKGELEEHLIQLELNCLHIFRPALLLGKRSEFRLGENIAAIVFKLLTPLLKGPLLHYRPILASTVARAMMDCACAEHRGVHIHSSKDMLLGEL